eukprot:gene35134-biopygen22935
MSVTSIMNSAISGMTAQEARLASVANNIAHAGTPGYTRTTTLVQSNLPHGAHATTIQHPQSNAQDGSTGDPATEITGMIDAQAGFAANVSAFESGADLWDVLATIRRD